MVARSIDEKSVRNLRKACHLRSSVEPDRDLRFIASDPAMRIAPETNPEKAATTALYLADSTNKSTPKPAKANPMSAPMTLPRTTSVSKKLNLSAYAEIPAFHPLNFLRKAWGLLFAVGRDLVK